MEIVRRSNKDQGSEDAQKEFKRMRRWISPRPRFTSVSRDEHTAVLNFLNRQCRLTEGGSFMGRIFHRYSFLCEHVETDPPGVLVLPTRFDRFTQFLKDVQNGTFQAMVKRLMTDLRNNHGFGVTWDLDLTIEGVPEEASGDYAHGCIVTDKDDGKPRTHHVVEE